MSGKTFVDTNVLVYAQDAADPNKQQIARDVLRTHADDLVFSAQVLSEFYVVVTRRLAKPMDPQAAATAVDHLSEHAIVATDEHLVREGIALSQAAQLSFWDGLIIAAARSGGCGSILTEDLATGSTIGGVRIVNPFSGESA